MQCTARACEACPPTPPDIHSENGRQGVINRCDEIKTQTHRTNHLGARDPAGDCKNNGGEGGGGDDDCDNDDDDDSVSDDCPKMEAIEATVHVEYTARSGWIYSLCDRK